MKTRIVTSNKLKLDEAARIIPSIEAIDLDLQEIQAVDVNDVVLHKAGSIAEMFPEDILLVEDTGIYIDDWNGLPGALIKWFIKDMGDKDFANLVCQGKESRTAIAKSAVAAVCHGKIVSWTGQTKGAIVQPKGESLGWNAIFLEESTGLTFGEMTFEQRLNVSMRKKPLEAAREWANSL